MRVEEFKKKTDDELLQMADDCFALVEARGVQEEPAHLLKAQFYMNEVDRRHDAKIARRDFLMELIVIGLILFEVILGIGGIVFGIVEGNKQAAILDRMNTSTAATATATQSVNTSSQDQAARLKALADEQSKSLDSLGEMNEKLQSSVKQTTSMVVAMQEQLKILKEEQANRQAQLAKKPKLQIYVGTILLTPTALLPATARQSTDDRSIYDIVLKNSGDATATKGSLRVILIGKGTWFESTTGANRVYEQPDSEIHTFLIPFDYLRPNVQIPMSFTIGYPKGQQLGVMVNFNVDVDELPAATPLGILIVVPRPQSPS